MPRETTRRVGPLVLGLAAMLSLSGCGPSEEPVPEITRTAAAPSMPETATPTLEPMAAMVNGRGILLADFLEEVGRYEQAKTELGIDLATLGAYREAILDTLIDRELLVQGALADGISISEEALDQRMAELAEEMGGNEAMGAWLTANQYSVASFRRALYAERMAAQFVQVLTSELPAAVEQVRARHILVETEAEALALIAQLAGGADFDALARRNSRDLSTRPGGGLLGWFPEGYLLVPEVEAEAFRLAIGEISGVVESGLGFHIVQTLERAERPLTSDMRLSLQEKTVFDWLQSMRETSAIERLLPQETGTS